MLKKSIFSQKIDIYSDSIYAKSMFVVSFWRHNVTWKSACFPAPERGDFSKNSDVLKLVGRVSLVRLMGWWDWFERNRITTALMISDTTKLMMSRFS